MLLADTDPSLQDRAVKERDDQAASIINETIRIWNNMWLASQARDSRITDNVHTLQKRCGDVLELLQTSIEAILAEETARPRRPAGEGMLSG
jgi:hypothetical protein